jgi:hypothetical protein
MKNNKRCGNCIHASKGFKMTDGTNHHCSHPSMVAGIENPSGFDTLVKWHFVCDNWIEKPKDNQHQTKRR